MQRINTVYLTIEQICDGWVFQEDEDRLTLRYHGREMAVFTLHLTRETVQWFIREHDLAGTAA